MYARLKIVASENSKFSMESLKERMSQKPARNRRPKKKKKKIYKFTFISPYPSTE